MSSTFWWGFIAGAIVGTLFMAAAWDTNRVEIIKTGAFTRDGHIYRVTPGKLSEAPQ